MSVHPFRCAPSAPRARFARGWILTWLCASLAAPLAAQSPAPAPVPTPTPTPNRAPDAAEDVAAEAAAAALAARAAEAARRAARPPGAPLPPVDPLEHLQRRLSERLSVQPINPAAGSRDLQLIGRQPATAAPGPRPGGSPAARSVVRRASAARPEEGLTWSYSGATAPEAWGRLRPEYALCASGERQSPIDIRAGLAVDLEPVQFEYGSAPFRVLDNGHTIQAQPEAGSALVLGGRRYALQHLHFHRPAETRIDGRQFEMSVHLVHRDDQGQLLVVALLLDPGPAHPVVQQVWNHLPLEKHQTVQARQALELVDLLPQDRRYFTYMGSLTTPPCTEGVQWVVMREPVSVSPEQIAIFDRLYPMNARPVQPLAGRRILQSD